MKTKALEFIAQVQGGKLPDETARQIGRAVRLLDGKRVRVTVAEVSKKRSLNQNSYYWGVVIAMVREFVNELGNDMDEDEVHEFLKRHVGKLATMIKLPDGSVTKALRSTRKLTPGEFEEYLEKIRAWAAEFGLIVPFPGEQFFNPLA